VDRGVAVVLTAFAGGLVAMQAPINSHLGKSVGTFQAATVSFAVGLVALALIAGIAGGGFGDLSEIRSVPVVYLIGGLLGAVYVTTVLVAVRTLGAGGVTAATIAGQLTMALVIDAAGLLGVAKQPVTGLRILGVALLAAGTFLLVRD
jgi:transporter family-2 protein